MDQRLFLSLVKRSSAKSCTSAVLGPKAGFESYPNVMTRAHDSGFWKEQRYEISWPTIFLITCRPRFICVASEAMYDDHATVRSVPIIFRGLGSVYSRSTLLRFILGIQY